MIYLWIKRIVLICLLGVILSLFVTLFSGEIQAYKLRNQNQQTAQGETPPAAVMEEIQNLKEEIKLDPTDASAYSSLGDLYFEAAKYNHALTLYKKAVEINGSDTNYRNNLAICYHLTGQDSKAFYQLNKALKIKPNSQNLWLTLGVISYETARTMNQAGNSKTQVEHYLSLSQKALKKAYLISPSSSAGEKAEKYYKSVFKDVPSPKSEGQKNGLTPSTAKIVSLSQTSAGSQIYFHLCLGVSDGRILSVGRYFSESLPSLFKGDTVRYSLLSDKSGVKITDAEGEILEFGFDNVSCDK